MPNLTPVALAAVLAGARAEAITECAALVTALQGQSPAVQAAALQGLTAEAVEAHQRAVTEAEVEALEAADRKAAASAPSTRKSKAVETSSEPELPATSGL